MKKISLTAIAAIAILAACTPYAEQADTPETRTAAVNRYFKAVPFADMMKDVATEMAAQFPPEQRLDFVQFMTTEIRLDLLEGAAKQSMTKHLTTKELNAFVEFLEKPEGKSAMVKMKFYMADIMPVIQSETARAIKKRQSTQ